MLTNVTVDGRRIGIVRQKGEKQQKIIKSHQIQRKWTQSSAFKSITVEEEEKVKKLHSVCLKQNTKKLCQQMKSANLTGVFEELNNSSMSLLERFFSILEWTRDKILSFFKMGKKGPSPRGNTTNTTN